MRYFGQIKAYNDKDNTLVLGMDDLSISEKNLFQHNVNNFLEIDFDDKRVISYKQQRKVYALLNSIAQSKKYDLEHIKGLLKQEFCQEKQQKMFSLSNCTMTTANDFIDYLVNFCLEWDVEFASKALDIAKDSYGWEINCLNNQKCCICGQKMQIAHVHAIGMGANRKKMVHIGYTVLPLCWKHHSMQHNIGIRTFLDKYVLTGVRIDEDLSRKLHLGRLHQKYEVHMGEPIEYTSKGVSY
ncbi:putative HNHc nuclease (plasmid) [Apilactobacillus apisilvae]|uniref:HNHc nuclease n=1 Tax=Apilactobacillus apisilvae TaxID=2923364 RepID=A0ABY4PJ49_9LACO|nr:putative HNHc nuclease [Apilactobacillus apisilvae]UQS85848.1 putative HNHc nuclease [Apilactobacillus apisilvae]